MKITKKVVKHSLEFIVFVILLTFFIIFYMKNEVGDFTKQRTSITIRHENSTELEFPSIVFANSCKTGSSLKPDTPREVARLRKDWTELPDT